MIEYFYLTQIWYLIGSSSPGQSEPGSNGNEGVLHIPQNSWTWASQPDEA